VDLAAVDLFASMGRPVAAGLKADASVQPEAPVAVFAGTPMLLFGEAQGDRIELTWDGGKLGLDVPAGDAETGEVVRLLRGSRLITVWESRYPSEEATAVLEKRRQSRVAARLVELSTTYGLASREMSLVAVVKRAGDRPGELPVTRVVPVGMAQDVAFDAYFSGPATAMLASQAFEEDMPAFCRTEVAELQSRVEFSLFGMARGTPPRAGSAIPSGNGLVDIAGMLEPDGGMPGDSTERRIARTIAAVYAFAADGHTLTAGTFRLHVARLAGFLKSVASRSRLIEAALEIASRGRPPRGKWLGLAVSPRTSMKEIEAALK
jgi:hypothetical protein